MVENVKQEFYDRSTSEITVKNSFLDQDEFK